VRARTIRIITWGVSIAPFLVLQVLLWRSEAGSVLAALVHRPYLWILYALLCMMLAERVFRLLMGVLKGRED
jgi:hypothetical protein